MKYAFLLFFFLSATLCAAVNLIEENFSAYPAFPAGWTKSPDVANWLVVSGNDAGGAAPGELQLGWTPANTGTFRFISPLFDTRQVHNMSLSFRHALSDFSTTNTFKIGVQISTDGATWTTLWADSSSVSIPATLVNVPFSFELGKSATTRIAFFFQGDTNDINDWWLDDILLSYENTLGYGTWPSTTIGVYGNLIIPGGYTLTLEAGTDIIMYPGAYVDVDGRLLVNGTQDNYVHFRQFSMPGMTWNGIVIFNVNPISNDSTLINYASIEDCIESAFTIYNTDKVRISSCHIRDNTAANGAGMNIYNSDLIVENCTISNNMATNYGSAISINNSSPVFRNNTINNNTAAVSYNIVCLNNCNLDGFTKNLIVNNTSAGSGTAVLLGSCTGAFHNNVIANNNMSGMYSSGGAMAVANCDIINNISDGITNDSNLLVINSIIWGNTGYQINNETTSTPLSVRYSCIQNGYSGTHNVSSYYYSNNFATDPLFINPTTGTGSGFNAVTADWRLQPHSPCIDTGDPGYPLNQDGSRADVGAYYRTLKPVITRAVDVAFDQGHQLALRWNRSDIDETFVYGAAYLVYRLGAARSETAMYVTDPAQINPELIAQNQTICWVDGTRTWTYLTQQPAVTFTDYECVVSTIQDSSSTGTHAETYMVMYYGPAGVWQSDSHTGYSVDNIPPYAPTRVAISHTSDDNLNLNWDDVTEGGLNGNSYPETNLITYKIYAGEMPDFTVGTASYILSTTNPMAVLNNQTAAHKFFKIIATDSE